MSFLNCFRCTQNFSENWHSLGIFGSWLKNWTTSVISSKLKVLLHVNNVWRARCVKRFAERQRFQDMPGRHATRIELTNCLTNTHFQFQLWMCMRLFVETYLEDSCHRRLDNTAINDCNRTSNSFLTFLCVLDSVIFNGNGTHFCRVLLFISFRRVLL